MKHKIFVFNNGGSEGWMEAAAIGDDGHYLAGHICSNEGYMHHDMGFTSEWKHDLYNKHFGEGNWELEWVERDKLNTHEGFNKAIELHKRLTPEQQKEDNQNSPKVELEFSEEPPNIN